MNKKVDIYTDGACSGNPGPGGWGVLIEIDNENIELSGGDRETTNNRMELMAAIKALEDSKYIDKIVKLNSEVKNWFKSELKSLNIKTKITEGNFSLIETSNDGAVKISNHLAKDGIIVRNLDSYNLPNFLRVSIGTKEEMEKTINSLKNLNE